MGSSLFTFPFARHLSSTFRNPLLSSSSSPLHRRPHRVTLTLAIRATTSRAKKEEIDSRVREQLENCYLLAGIDYGGMTARQMGTLRRSLPESVKVTVANNTLFGKAIEGTPWEPVTPCVMGMNAWMVVHTEEIPLALKAVREFQKERKLEGTNDFVGGLFEGRLYPPVEFKRLETRPSKAEVFAKLLGSLHGPPAALVVTLQVCAHKLKEKEEAQGS